MKLLAASAYLSCPAKHIPRFYRHLRGLYRWRSLHTGTFQLQGTDLADSTRIQYCCEWSTSGICAGVRVQAQHVEPDCRFEIIDMFHCLASVKYPSAFSSTFWVSPSILLHSSLPLRPYPLNDKSASVPTSPPYGFHSGPSAWQGSAFRHLRWLWAYHQKTASVWNWMSNYLSIVFLLTIASTVSFESLERPVPGSLSSHLPGTIAFLTLRSLHSDFVGCLPQRSFLFQRCLAILPIEPLNEVTNDTRYTFEGSWPPHRIVSSLYR